MIETLLTAEERYHLPVEGARDYAMILLDPSGRIIGWNAGAARIMGWSKAEVLGKPVDLIFTPEDTAEGIAAQEISKAAAEGRALDRRWHLRKDGSRFFADGIMERLEDEAEQPRGFAKILRDITAQEEHERRERFLAALAERTRRLTDPDDIIADALRSVGQFLGLSRCTFADINFAADTCTIRLDYCADASVGSIVGVFPLSSFGSFINTEFQVGRAVVVDDVRADPMRVPPENVATYESIGVLAHVTAPVVHSDRLVSCIGAHSAVPRHWKPEEVELLQAVVERTWLTVEVTRQQRALVREAEATARILESIADGFFTLDRDWKVTRVNDQAERLMTKTRSQILGKIFWDVYPNLVGTIFEREYRRAVREGIPVSFEEYYSPLEAWLEVRAYPSADGLSVFYQNITSRKRAEEERERLAERERQIASQLQAALQPDLPEHILGLSVGKFTRPALQEAQIGGDFYDVFPLDKELYALVIGDVSGKGLAAAQQLALIRNSLRTTLYLYRTPAQAASSLNKIVSAYDLLVGFVTAWVGVYDAATGRITYCSCGHEPGLIRRVGGAVEELGPTGPPLGVSESADYREISVSLSSGDALLLYTDGISEAGPNRLEMLGTDRLAHLLGTLPSDLDVQVEAEALVEKVSAYANGVFRDDVALLLARRQ